MWRPSRCSRLPVAILPILLSVLALGAAPARAQLPPGPPPPTWQTLSIEPSTDRLGADYRIFDLPVADVEPCRRACAEDARCAAYTYADAGLVSAQPRCFLKEGVPAPSPKAGCTSGMKRPAAGPPVGPRLSVEPSMDRLGADYRIFDLQVADVEPCRRACAEDVRCAAYTYADAGLVSAQPRCFLKRSAPPARPKAGCTSGARTVGPSAPMPPPPPPPIGRY